MVTVTTLPKTLGTVNCKFLYNSTQFVTTSTTDVEITTFTNYNSLSIANNQFFGNRFYMTFAQGSVQVAGSVAIKEQNTGNANEIRGSVNTGSGGSTLSYHGGSDGSRNTSGSTWSTWKTYGRANNVTYGGTLTVPADSSGTLGYFRVFQGEYYYSDKTTSGKKISFNYKLYIDQIQAYGMYNQPEWNTTYYSTTATYYQNPLSFDNTAYNVNNYTAPQTWTIQSITTDGLSVNVGADNPTYLFVYFTWSGSKLSFT